MQRVGTAQHQRVYARPRRAMPRLCPTLQMPAPTDLPIICENALEPAILDTNRNVLPILLVYGFAPVQRRGCAVNR